MQTVALIVAAGSGTRFGSEVPKQYLNIGKKPILRQCVDVFLSHPDIAAVKVVIAADHGDFYESALKGLQLLTPVIGGENRQESVLLGLESLYNGGFSHVLIHDAARPFVSHDDISRLLDALKNHDAAILATPVTDTIKQVDGTHIKATLERSKLWQAQTPQGFRLDKIIAAHRQMTGKSLTDDAAVMEATGYEVAIVPGSPSNRKITTAADMAATPTTTRSGIGYDVHCFKPSPDGTIRLGGIDIPHHNALEGHSDADVVLHAITDALLGTIADGDIGQHFSPKDPKWQGCDSMHFLQEAYRRVISHGGEIVNIDVTIIGEEPKISPHRYAMRKRIAEGLHIEMGDISVKATTTEGLGFTGRKEGLACMAIVSVSV